MDAPPSLIALSHYRNHHGRVSTTYSAWHWFDGFNSFDVSRGSYFATVGSGSIETLNCLRNVWAQLCYGP